jgi:glycosyltransferase involved in cell wall biosynthesis
MIGKVDLVMWAKNGENVLPTVLKRIDEVIPHEVVCHKILVDDHSTDRTTKIAKEFNWNVYPNPKTGIPSGANEALRHVDQDFFISVEQDVVLAKDWWEKIPPHMNGNKVAVAQGIRMSTEPTLRKLEEYVYSRLKSSVNDPIRFGVSMDNNLFRTKIIRQLGGFPSNCLVCKNTLLRKSRFALATSSINAEVISNKSFKSFNNCV